MRRGTVRFLRQNWSQGGTNISFSKTEKLVKEDTGYFILWSCTKVGVLKENTMKSLAIVIALVALVGLMAYTNPSMDDFSNYVRQYVIKESKKEMKDPVGQLLTSILGGVAGGVVGSQTVRTDYILFSIYEVQLGRERFKALGICRNFVLLEKPDPKRLKWGDIPSG